jgi:hypothetical protein
LALRGKYIFQQSIGSTVTPLYRSQALIAIAVGHTIIAVCDTLIFREIQPVDFI